MRKLLAGLLALTTVIFATAAPAFAQSGGTPSNAVGVWGQDRVTGLPCIMSPAATSGSATCALPNQPTGSTQAAVIITPTVTAASAYASGNSVGGLLTFANAFRTTGVTGATGILQKVVVDFKSSQTAATDLVIFNGNPAGTTITDKTAFSLAVADWNRVVGVVHLTDCTNLGTPSVCQATGLALPIQGVSTSNLYGALVTRGTPTFTATTDVAVYVQILQD